MKKIFTIFMCAVMSIGIASAQYGPTKFTDNVTVGIKGGVSTSMTNFYKGVSPVIGIDLEKSITPWLGVGIDANTMIANPWGSNNPHTVFDVVNVNLLGKWNLRNTWNYDGTRKFFEPSVFAGIGWGNRTCSDFAPRNYVVNKVGADFDFNLGDEKAWGVRISPACVWGPVTNGKLNAKYGGFEITAGVIYHFKNKDGNRSYTKVTPRNQSEIDALNDKIKFLRGKTRDLAAENKALKVAIANETRKEPKVVTVTDTVYINLNTHEYFKVGSAKIVSKAAIRNLVNNLDKTKHYVILGYASEEGDYEYNLKLSEKRAENVYNAMIEYGFKPENLEFRGEGPTTKFSESDREANRVVVVKEQ
jgi:outer membrane protein OmpA-like peptidoglycan-associated protein